MAGIAEFLCLCVDATDGRRLGQWWADVLGLEWRSHREGSPARGEVRGPNPGQRILFLDVAEPKTVKRRIHLDIYATSLEDLERRGATIIEPQREGWRWTIMADPEGGEFCAFLRDELPAERLHGVVIDSKEPAAIAQWWAEVYDASLEHHDDGYSTVEHTPGMPDLTLDFVPVPEPKTVKNRVHWDVRAADVDALVSRGASVLRRPDAEIDWTVMADPEGNEFCVFPPAS
jgi:Glyoxalase-like domain